MNLTAFCSTFVELAAKLDIPTQINNYKPKNYFFHKMHFFSPPIKIIRNFAASKVENINKQQH